LLTGENGVSGKIVFAAAKIRELSTTADSCMTRVIHFIIFSSLEISNEIAVWMTCNKNNPKYPTHNWYFFLFSDRALRLRTQYLSSTLQKAQKSRESSQANKMREKGRTRFLLHIAPPPE